MTSPSGTLRRPSRRLLLRIRHPSRWRRAPRRDTVSHPVPVPSDVSVANAGTGLRVRRIGTPSPLDGLVRLVPALPELLPAGAHGPRHLDALLLNHDAQDDPSCDGLIAQAEAAGVPLIRYLAPMTGSEPSPVEPGSAGRAQVRVGPALDTGPWPRPIVDLGVNHPMGFRRASGTRAAVGSLAPGPNFLQTWARLAVSATAAKTPTEPPPSAAQATDLGELARFHHHLGVLDAPELHRDASSHAQWLATMAATGVPIVCTELPTEVANRLGDTLVASLVSARVHDLTDVDARERVSVRQRTAALREHGANRAWASIATAAGIRPTPEPTISVLAATNRPEHLRHLVDQYERFAYGPRELIVALHGDAFADDAEERLRGRVTTELTVLRIEQAAPLGDVLNRATEAAGGQLVTKLDDDDLYDTYHLDDLLAALRYSRATIVGKGSEFVYLAELDITLRRMPNGAETGSRSVAGGTLMIARDDLLQVGRWQRAPRFIDQLLIDDVLEAGGRLHRTHGHGFVLNRHGRGHTWDSSVDYFLQQAVRQWTGLDLAAAGFWDTSGGLP